MSNLVNLALFAWFPLAFVLFSMLPRHRAVLITVIGGALFLPEIHMVRLSPEAPDAFVFLILKLTKYNVIAFSTLLAAIALVMPGIGPIVAAGPLAAELGEAAGHLAGSLASVLTSAGLSREKAEALQREVSRGAILLGVHVVASDVNRVLERLSATGATQLEMVNWE